MGIEEHVRALIHTALTDLVRDGAVPSDVLGADFAVERPKRPEHGDLATNAALALQKLAKKQPRELAVLLQAKLSASPDVQAAEIAGPGFLNLRLAPSVFHAVVTDVLAQGAAYGRAPAAIGERVLVEFVSANPTGPLLVSHARGAILGDAVARLLEAAGHRVVREYYVNDFGNQVKLLGDSVRAILEGRETPEGGYGAPYVKELADWIAEHAAAALADPDPWVLARTCITRVLEGVPGSQTLPGIKRTLASIGVVHDVWISEESLHRWGRVAAALGELKQRGYLEEREGALFFKSETEGDDKDRVVKKRDGAFTYFASDIAYHADKIGRGFDRLIDVWGADHHGYVARVRAAITALGLPENRFEVLLYQLVFLLRNGEPVKMGKRLGNIVTIEEILDEIDGAAGRTGAGADALRYFYLSRRSDTTVDFDIEIAKKASLDNPAIYLQYGYARASSILRRAKDVFHVEPPRPTAAALAALVHPDELAVTARLGRFPAVVREAAALREPHRIVFYLQELSQEFQSYFTRHKDDPILPGAKVTAHEGWETSWDWDKTRARLAWVLAIRTAYGAALGLLGITALDRMERIEARGAGEAGEEIGA
ncbi:Arginyl-tRNA synthetase [Minicystis rosea]|nr:Arginyl-tRNA synthetase [Minicystis rosea]